MFFRLKMKMIPNLNELRTPNCIWLFMVSFTFHQIQVSWGQEGKAATCPDVKLKEDFKLDQFSGMWYKIKDNGHPYDSDRVCASLQFLNKEGEEGYHVINQFAHSWSDRAQSHRQQKLYSLVTASSSEPAKLTLKPVQEDGGIGGEKTFWILHTDYTTYAVSYSCQPPLLDDAPLNRELIILARRKTLCPEALAAIVDLLKDEGIGPIDQLNNFDQDNC